MATNLRLRPELEAAVKVEAERSHRSQQDVIRAAIETYLDLDPEPPSGLDAARRVYRHKLIGPRTSFRRETDLPVMPAGVSSTELLQREDRL